MISRFAGDHKLPCMIIVKAKLPFFLSFRFGPDTIHSDTVDN